MGSASPGYWEREGVAASGGADGELREGGEWRPIGGAFVPGQIGRSDCAGGQAAAHFGFGVGADFAAGLVDEETP